MMGDETPQMMGVDPGLFGSPDFIGVRAALIREVGAVEAIVLTRIFYRASEEYRHAYEHGGHWWWRAPTQTIAEETGLSEKQVRRSLTVLRVAGYIVVEQHQIGGNYDRAFSVRVNLGEGQMHLPQRANQEVPQRADVPIKTEEDTPPTPSEADAAFDALWTAWPKKVKRQEAQRAWRRLTSKEKDEAIPRLVAHANAYRQHTPAQYIPGLAPFLNGRRWTEDLAVASGRGGVQKPALPPGVSVHDAWMYQ